MSDHIRLLTPGPLALSPAVKACMNTDLGSRDGDFRTVTAGIRNAILDLAGARSHHGVIPLQGSGTFAIEGVLTTFVKPDDKVLVCVNGIYGELAVRILGRHGLRHDAVTRPIHQPVPVDEVAARLDADPSFTHLYFVHCETTSGILNPMAELVEVARRRGVVTIVDAMSSFGAIDIDAELTPFDILVSSGNKCLEAPPGIAFAIVRRDLLKPEHARATTYVLDLLDQWRVMEATGEWRSTPPTHIAQALLAGLQALQAERVAGRRARYARIADRLLAGLKPLGIAPIVAPELQTPICLALRCPAITDADDFARYYQHLRDANLLIYARYHQATQSFRVGCIGQIEPEWVDDLIAATQRFLGADVHTMRRRQNRLPETPRVLANIPDAAA